MQTNRDGQQGDTALSSRPVVNARGGNQTRTNKLFEYPPGFSPTQSPYKPREKSEAGMSSSFPRPAAAAGGGGVGGRPRRIDDAFARLVDFLAPPVVHPDDEDENNNEYSDEDALAAAEERRHHENVERAWRILESHTASASASTGTGDVLGIDGDNVGIIPGGGGGSPAASINHASDLIKRKLLRENASPDKAVRFSNLYSRLLTQPVLSQKWAILYLLYRLSSSSTDGDGQFQDQIQGLERSRSPLMDDGNLQNMLFKGQRPRRGTGSRPTTGSYEDDEVDVDTEEDEEEREDDDDGPAPSSSASQIPARRRNRTPSSRRNEPREKETESGDESLTERVRADVNQQQQSPRTDTTSMERKQRHSEYQNQSSFSKGRQTAAESSLESRILRDLPFNLQGLSSTNLEFASASVVKLPPTLPVPIVSMLHSLAEPCLLYKGLAGFVDSSDGGLVSQSLRAAIATELRSYLGLVATLEGEIRRALLAIGEATDSRGVAKGGVTLKRCVVWMRDATMALRLMSLIVEESRRKKGGQLISLIHGFSSSHGDPFVCAFAEKLLAHVTRPFYGMLRLWIYDGELSDPYKEFFVVEPEFRPSTDPRRIATSVWEDKYKLDDEMVPSIITRDFAKKVFLIGKSLNFIRYGCGDSAWVEAYSKEASKELRYGDTASLETFIDEAYKTTMARLIHLMDDKFTLFEHLNALKKYLLLGQGDFIALLMESLASNLDRPANSQYRHTLTAQLEHAIRASNAQYDSPDVLRRLDARMLELSHGEIGWDCFTLEYKIDAPVDVVITPWASTQYLKVFNFLWRVKRVEFALGSTWRQCMTGARGVLGNVDDKFGPDWKRARCVMAEMIHFVCQLQYYILFEVIESSWDQLQAAISKPACTLDDLIEAHTTYLNSITHKGLLGSSSSSSSTTARSTSSSSSSGGKPHPEESFLAQLHQILKVMLAYKDAADGLYSLSVAEFTRRQELSAKIETRTAQGRWGVTDRDLFPPSSTSSHHPDHHAIAADENMLTSLRSRLRELSADFRSRLNVLLGDLAYQPDVDMRFLGVVMNFNDVYEPVRRRRTTTGGNSAKDKERARRKAAANGGGGGGGGGAATAPASGIATAEGTVRKEQRNRS